MVKSILVFLFLMVASATAFAGDLLFPTSSVTPEREWKKMGSNPFNGTPEEGCLLLGLGEKKCAKYAEMRRAQKWVTLRVQNGVVYDKLLFANGKVMSNVKVNLDNPPSRLARVFTIDGDALITHDGCNNIAVVYDWNADEPKVAQKYIAHPRREPVFAGSGCAFENERLITVSLYEAKASQNECAQRLLLPKGGRINRPQGVTDEFDGNGLDEDRLSRTCGASLNKELIQNKFGHGVMNHGIEVVIVQDDLDYVVFQGAIRGNVLNPSAEFADKVLEGHILSIPDQFTSGILEIRFDTNEKLMSPTASGIREYVEKLPRGCHVARFHGIEADEQQDVAQQ